MACRIEDYAMLGDFHSAALVGRNGSIDWMCVPRFDSNACFAALLGKPEHGRWLLAPKGKVTQTKRQYRGDTLILETEFNTDSGSVRLIDLMPLHDSVTGLVRVVEGLRGQVPMQMRINLRFDYGSIFPWVRRQENGDIWATAGPDTLRLSTQVPLRSEENEGRTEFTISEGERVPFVLTWHLSHEPEPPRLNAELALQETEAWWSAWSSQCTYQGPWRDALMRALIALKAMTYAPTGGIVAAVTTSLPEKIGGERNWDYRFCWLRDATFTLYSLMAAGFADEALAWREWLLRAVAGKASQIQVLYGVAGERRQTELNIDWLPGYEGSSPVRIGNAASTQLQLDVYGEVIDAMFQCRRLGLDPEDAAWNLERGLLDFLESNWKLPDKGIWEVRGPDRHFTHSKVMMWVAFDRAVKSVEQFGLEGPVDQWRAVRDSIHAEICQKAFNSQKNAFMQYYGATSLDASLLLMPLVGFLPGDDPRVLGTVEAIGRELMRDGFVARYTTQETVDGLPPGEGAFLACTFWYCDNLTLQGRRDEAKQLLERLLDLRNDVGLLSEEYDPYEKRMVGNFPQAFSLVSLVNTICNICHECGPVSQRTGG
ncbi:MAG TPA: glycoside hydrolase family 15 protein [Isosphaeraceae bacterium]|jgi:GH15 family glucan-1,4-alpha-glucosidase|nr:glycoside hydrolase family 15 protein [Isosphaeraceae bacterium]